MILIRREEIPYEIIVGLDVSSYDIKAYFLNGEGAEDWVGAHKCL